MSKFMLSGLCLLFALLAFALAALGFIEVQAFGFLSHKTDYELAASMPLRVLAGAQAAMGICLAVLAARPVASRTKARRLAVLVAALACTAVCVFIGIPWYFQDHLGLDHGQGG